MLIIYLWISKASFETIKLITNHENKTIIDWMNTCKTILIHGMEGADNERKVDEVSGEIIFTGQVVWSRFLQAMKNAQTLQLPHPSQSLPLAMASVSIPTMPMIMNHPEGMTYISSSQI
jgi:2-iminoacetate synthase ThiH